MSWDPLWEAIFRERGDWGRYPPEELIRFIARHFYKVADRRRVRILDLGAGIGSATWYLCREGFDVAALEGAPTALEMLSKRLAQDGLVAELVQGDISSLPFPEESFDCVVELKCLMCNDQATTKGAIGEVFRILKRGGRFFSSTPQTGTYGDGLGEQVQRNCWRDAQEGPYAGMGLVRFTEERDIPDLYAPFSEILADRNEYTVGGGKWIKHWSISGIKDR